MMHKLNQYDYFMAEYSASLVIEINGVKHSSDPYELEWHVNTAFIMFKYEHVSAECVTALLKAPLWPLDWKKSDLEFSTAINRHIGNKKNNSHY